MKKEKAKTSQLTKFVVFLIVLSMIGLILPDRSSDRSSISQEGFNVYRAKARIVNTLDEILRDPNSREDTRFGGLVEREGVYYIMCSFRSRNGFGGMKRSEILFAFDKNANMVSYK